MHRKGEDICKKCHSQVIYDTYYDPQYGARGTAHPGDKVSRTKIGTLKRSRPPGQRTRARAWADNAQRPNDIPDNDDLREHTAPHDGRDPTIRDTRDNHIHSSDHVIKMRIFMAMEQCYGSDDQRTLDAKADWEAALRAHRDALDEDAQAEQRLLESKKHIERLQRTLSRAQEDVLTQKSLIHKKQDEFVHAAAKLNELHQNKQRLELLVQEADHAHRRRAQQIYTADSTRDARERHTRAICTLLGGRHAPQPPIAPH